MQDKNVKKEKSKGFRLVLKSAALTLAAMTLIAIGFYLADSLFGSF